MKVLVLGSGVIGVTSAYYLARAGHEVTVVDRQPEPALETSFANAGEVSPGYSAPWAAPGLPLKAIKWLFMRHRPLVIWPMLDPAMWLWGCASCAIARTPATKRTRTGCSSSRSTAASVSKRCAPTPGMTYDERMQGTLQLFRTSAQVEGAGADMAILERFGVPHEFLDRAGCVRAEPALGKVQEKISGGLRLPGDETGDCFKFTQNLARIAAKSGVVFRQGVHVRALRAEAGHVASVATDAGEMAADAYVVALGSYSPLMVRSLRLRLPVYPVKGYS